MLYKFLIQHKFLEFDIDEFGGVHTLHPDISRLPLKNCLQFKLLPTANHSFSKFPSLPAVNRIKI